MVARQRADVATTGIAIVDVVGLCRATDLGAAEPRHGAWRGGTWTVYRLRRASCLELRHMPIHLLRPLPRPVPPMNFAPATTPSLHGIELCAGVELRVDEPFATGCFTRFICMFHMFSL